MELISRKEAKEQGLSYYYTGVPCKHGHVSKRHVRSSGCYECARIENSQAKRHRNRNQKEYQNTYRRNRPDINMLSRAKKRARDNNIPCNIDITDIIIPDKCPILGIDLFVNKQQKAPCDNSPSLDRIIPEFGYVKGNVQVISHKANTLKSNGTYEEFRAIMEYIKINS